MIARVHNLFLANLTLFQSWLAYPERHFVLTQNKLSVRGCLKGFMLLHVWGQLAILSHLMDLRDAEACMTKIDNWFIFSWGDRMLQLIELMADFHHLRPLKMWSPISIFPLQQDWAEMLFFSSMTILSKTLFLPSSLFECWVSCLEWE